MGMEVMIWVNACQTRRSDRTCIGTFWAIVFTHMQGMYHSVDVPNNKNFHNGDDDNPSGQGHVKLILLDTRWFRENHYIPTVASKLPMGNAVACVTRCATAGLNLWKYAQWWGKQRCEDAELFGEEQWKRIAF